MKTSVNKLNFFSNTAAIAISEFWLELNRKSKAKIENQIQQRASKILQELECIVIV